MSNKSFGILKNFLPNSSANEYKAPSEDPSASLIPDEEILMQSTRPREENHDSDPFFQRGITFTRGFTALDAAASFRRTFTQTLGIHMDEDSDEIWTQKLLETYNAANKLGVEGDIPLPAEFARNIEFWKTMLVVGLVAAFLGLCSLVFLNVVDFVPKVWINNWYATVDDSYFKCPDCLIKDHCTCDKYKNADFYNGQTYWIGVTACAGLIVGLLRYVLNYPDNLPGLFKEILTYHVDPKWCPSTLLISMISLAGGASLVALGPEQALASIGGGLATYLGENLIYNDEDYRKLLVLGGMASSLGGLFPSPFLGVLMILELGKMPKTHMESTLILSGGACVSFMVYYALVDYTYIETLSNHGIFFTLEWDFELVHCFTAIAIGVVSACLGIVIMLSIGISRQIFNRIRLRLTNYKFFQALIPPILGGTIIGLVNYALPLTIGNGNQVVAPVIAFAVNNKLSRNLLVCSAFGKAFVLGVSMSCGFVGGFVFPIITIGVMAGIVTSSYYPSLPMGLCIGCFMCGLPSSICPMPFTLAGLTICVFFFGLYQTFPIFLSCIVSYTLVVGSGLFGELQRRGGNAPPRSSESKKEKTIDEIRAQEEQKLEQQFAFEKYYSVQKGTVKHSA